MSTPPKWQSVGEFAGAVVAACPHCGNRDPRLQLKPEWDPLQWAKLVNILTADRKACGSRGIHDPMVCLGGHSSSPCGPCICWAFRALELIAEIVGVELPVREELT